MGNLRSGATLLVVWIGHAAVWCNPASNDPTKHSEPATALQEWLLTVRQQGLNESKSIGQDPADLPSQEGNIITSENSNAAPPNKQTATGITVDLQEQCRVFCLENHETDDSFFHKRHNKCRCYLYDHITYNEYNMESNGIENHSKSSSSLVLVYSHVTTYSLRNYKPTEETHDDYSSDTITDWITNFINRFFNSPIDISGLDDSPTSPEGLTSLEPESPTKNITTPAPQIYNFKENP